MTGFKVKGIDVTHASLHVEVNQLLGRLFEGSYGAFFSGGSEEVA